MWYMYSHDYVFLAVIGPSLHPGSRFASCQKVPFFIYTFIMNEWMKYMWNMLYKQTKYMREVRYFFWAVAKPRNWIFHWREWQKRPNIAPNASRKLNEDVYECLCVCLCDEQWAAEATCSRYRRYLRSTRRSIFCYLRFRRENGLLPILNVFYFRSSVFFLGIFLYEDMSF